MSIFYITTSIVSKTSIRGVNVFNNVTTPSIDLVICVETTSITVICKYPFSFSKVKIHILYQTAVLTLYKYIQLNLAIRILEFLLYCLYILMSIQVIRLLYF